MEAYSHRGPASRCVPLDDAVVLPRSAVPRRLRDDLAETPRVAPIRVGPRLLVMRRDGVILAIDTATDATLWERSIGRPSWHPNDAAIVARGDTAWVFKRPPKRGRLPSEGHLVELETATGSILRETPMPPVDLVEGVVVGDCIVTPTPEGITAIGLDGEPRWHRDQPEELDTLAAGADTVLTNDGGRGIAALELASGRVRWSIEGSAAYSTAIVDDTAIATIDDEVLALDLSTGSIRWRTDVSATASQPFATQDGDVIIVGHAHIERRALASGELLASRDLDRSSLPIRALAAFFTVPRVTRDLVVVSAPNGPVVAFSRDELDVLWCADVAAKRATTDPPVLAGGRIYVSDMTGALDVF